MGNKTYETNLEVIARIATEKEEENDYFLQYIRYRDGQQLDELAHRLNKEVGDAVDCTQCGHCCSHLMVNILPHEIENLANYLGKTVEETKEEHIEESLAGRCIIKSIPCHFLDDKKCSIYETRFKECREFPHLHKPGFKERLLGTLLHYGSCPIIYNVIEEAKHETGFYTTGE